MKPLHPAAPLPWNTVYQAAWDVFLTQPQRQIRLQSCIGSHRHRRSGGRVGRDDLPGQRQYQRRRTASGLAVDATWAALIQHTFPSSSVSQNTDQVFIDAWKQAIDACESIFSGVTLFIAADVGDDFPDFSQT